MRYQGSQLANRSFEKLQNDVYGEKQQQYFVFHNFVGLQAADSPRVVLLNSEIDRVAKRIDAFTEMF